MPEIRNKDRPTNRLSSQKWLILTVNCIAMLGVSYSYDIPSALHRSLEDFMPSDDVNFAYMFNLLYSIYSIPNIILPFFAGAIVDRLGPDKCMILFGSLTLSGQMILAFGVKMETWSIMLIGRFFYGLGGESIGVASSTLNSEWFDGQELALAFGINMALSRFGSVLNNFLSPFIAGRISPPFAFDVGVIMNFITVAASLLIVLLQTRNRRVLANQDEQSIPKLNEALLDNHAKINRVDNLQLRQIDSAKSHRSSICIVAKFGPLFWLISLACLVVYGCILPFNNVASGILLQRNYFTRPPADCTLRFPDQCTFGELEPFGLNPSINGSGLPCLFDEYNAPVLPSSIHVSRNNTDTSWKKTSYVFEALNDSDVDCTDSFWSKACTKDYCDSQRKAAAKSGRIMSIPYIMSIFLAPCLGHVVDRIQQRAILAIIASLILVLVHMILACTQSSPILPLIQQGIAYALFSSVIWPSIPLITQPQYVGTAFGTIVAIQNIGLATFPLIIAAIYNQNHQRYIPNVEYFFVASATFGLVIGILIHVVDGRTGDRLNGPSKPPNREDILAPLLSDEFE